MYSVGFSPVIMFDGIDMKIFPEEILFFDLMSFYGMKIMATQQLH